MTVTIPALPLPVRWRTPALTAQSARYWLGLYATMAMETAVHCDTPAVQVHLGFLRGNHSDHSRSTLHAILYSLLTRGKLLMHLCPR